MPQCVGLFIPSYMKYQTDISLIKLKKKGTLKMTHLTC